MPPQPWTLAPLRSDAATWQTVATQRRVLAIAHTVTAAVRLLDVLPVVGSDPRIQVVFSCTGSSAFANGTPEYLANCGVMVAPWSEVIKAEFDVAIAASYGGDLYNVRAPLVIIPHGFGYNKYLAPVEPSSRRAVEPSSRRSSGCRSRGCCTTESWSPGSSSCRTTSSSNG